MAFSRDGYTKKLTIKVSVKAEGDHPASLQLALSGKDRQKMSGTLAELAGSHTWSGKLCDGTAVTIGYTVNPDGTVAYGSATGGTATVKTGEHGFTARFDGTKVKVMISLKQAKDGSYSLQTVGQARRLRSPDRPQPLGQHPGQAGCRPALRPPRQPLRRPQGRRLRRQGQASLTLAPEGHASRGGLRFGGALLLLILALAACGSSGPSPATADGPTGAPVSTSAGPSAVVSTPSAVVSTSATAAPTPTPVAGDLLAAALEPLRAELSFETSVTVDGAVVVSATGRSVGAASELSVTTAGRTVDYLRVPPRAWAREAGGSWVLVDATTAPTAPLDVLSTPATLALVASDGGSSGLTATYPAAALGLTGDPVTVTITTDARGVTFTYETTVSGRKTTSTTTLRPSAGDPIVAPGG